MGQNRGEIKNNITKKKKNALFTRYPQYNFVYYTNFIIYI